MIRKIYDEVFREGVILVYNCTTEEVNAYLKKIGSEDTVNNFTLGQVCRTKEGRYRIVFIRDINDTLTIIHEVFHLVMRICDYRGIPVIGSESPNETSTDETAAYMMEFYMRNILKYAKSQNNHP